jgi:RNA polymerase sigma-70 factor (ECF subfamily)
MTAMTVVTESADAAAMAAAAQGDDAAFSRLYREHRGSVYRVAYGVLLDETEARDIVQDTFLELHRARRRWRPDASIRTWLYRVALNRALSIRRRVLLAARSLLPNAAHPPPDRLVGQREALRLVSRSLAQLRPQQRAVVVLALEADLTPTDIAAILHVTPNAARVTLHRGLEAVRGQLRAAGIDTSLDEEPLHAFAETDDP